MVKISPRSPKANAYAQRWAHTVWAEVIDRMLIDTVFTAIGVQIVKTPIRAPRANAKAERRIASGRRERLNRMLIAGELRLQLALSEYADHYLTLRVPKISSAQVEVSAAE